MVTLKRLRKIKDNFEQDLLSTLGDIGQVEWGKGIKEIPSDVRTYKKLWTLGFLPDVSNFNAPGMQYEEPPQNPDASQSQEDWLKKEKRRLAKSGYVKAPEIVAPDFSKDDPFWRDKKYLPEKFRDGQKWIENDTWRFAIQDAVFTTKSGGIRPGDDFNPLMLARLFDTPSLFGIRQMEIEENMKAQHRYGYEHGKQVEDIGKSLDVVDTFNKQSDYFWDDLPVKSYKRESSPKGTMHHERLGMEHGLAWREQSKDTWITKERICHVCQNMATPENDYGIFPLCQKCKGRA
jgi:hypothetical protein